MQTGSDTLKSIEQALRDLQERERGFQDELNGANDERGDLLSQRVASFKDLARVRARHALADGVVDQADRLSEQVEGILAARQKTIETLRDRAGAAQTKREKLLASHEKLLKKISDLEDRLDELAKKAQAELSTEKSYRKARKDLDEATAIYERADKKTKQAQSDRDAKGSPYRDDQLFMYLWRRNYGRDGYEANGLITWADGLVAGLVGYHDARANYAVLNEIPIRLREHVERLGEKLRAAQDVVNQLEADKIAELAGSDLTGDLAKARKLQASQNKQLEQLAGEMSETVSQLNLYSEGRDRSFLQAIELSAAFLERGSLDQLRALARTTIEPSDDQIVAKIAGIDAKVDKLRKRNQELQDKLETTFKRKEELIRLSADFRHSYYDDPGSVFMPSSDMNNLLSLLLRGAITAAEYWVRAQRGQSWRSRPADPFRRSSGMPPLGGMFGGSRRGGGRRGGGGGFSTGGGF